MPWPNLLLPASLCSCACRYYNSQFANIQNSSIPDIYRYCSKTRRDFSTAVMWRSYCVYRPLLCKQIHLDQVLLCMHVHSCSHLLRGHCMRKAQMIINLKMNFYLNFMLYTYLHAPLKVFHCLWIYIYFEHFRFIIT